MIVTGRFLRGEGIEREEGLIRIVANLHKSRSFDFLNKKAQSSHTMFITWNVVLSNTPLHWMSMNNCVLFSKLKFVISNHSFGQLPPSTRRYRRCVAGAATTNTAIKANNVAISIIAGSRPFPLYFDICKKIWTT